MPALDFTAWPSKPAAPPAGSAGAPRQTARTGAPKAGAKTGAKAGSPGAADGEFGQLVDRLADTPEEGRASSAGVSTRRSRETVLDGEESAAEPRAKKSDADGASGTANDAPANLASVASNPPAFPWTLPLNPSLWNIETVQVDGESASETGDGDGNSVIGAATTAIADGAAGACLATLPDTGTGEKASAAFEIRVDTPIAVNPASTTIAAASASSVKGSESVEEGSASDAIDAFAWTGAVGAAGALSTGAGANVTETAAGGDLLANTNIAGAGLANAAVTGEPISRRRRRLRDRAVSGQCAGQQTFRTDINRRSQRQCSSRAERDGRRHEGGCCRAVPRPRRPRVRWAGECGARRAASWGSGARAGADRTTAGARIRPRDHTFRDREARGERRWGCRDSDRRAAGVGASDDAAAANAAAIAAAIDPSAANAGDASGVTIATAGNETGVGAGAVASASSSRSRNAKQASKDSSADSDNSIAGVSSWAAAAAAKYAEAAGAGTSSGSDLRDSGSNADAAASIALAGRAGGDTGTIAPIGFDARVLAASRADGAAASELPGDGRVSPRS